ncbi:nfo [Ecytonucleospora hepatopenaei]|uniref:Apurinic-apyrimidinic endonuclease 1 n=1 Tax=Ecytonucleospora hepatopenaei TaxID=646526 RepID=A0A1W0E6C5_9MICR|nr:nfo [Ecytonucleospora hepatopenaei]
MNKKIGAHLSIAKGLGTLQEQMDLLEAEACAIFLKNQRRFAFKSISKKEISEFKKVNNPKMILPHGSYLINLANDTEGKMYDLFLDDLIRCDLLGISLYNFHPGFNKVKNMELSIKRIADAINKAHLSTKDVVVCIENMAGQGSVIGSRFEEIREIISQIENKKRIGVVLDTCHLFAAGYDIRTKESFACVMEQFEKIIGLEYLKGLHINDSKTELGSKKDRHEEIGKGKIGLEAFKYLMNSDIFDNMPLILETPNPEIYKDEITLLRSLVEK